MSDEREVRDRSIRPPDRVEVTGPEQTDVYDVWEPEPHRARGVTVGLVHGGFWREQYDRHHLAPLAAALARDGFHVANLEYPRIGMTGGGWPGTGTALLTRVESVHADPDLPDTVVLVGHSAGGHLVLWLASGARARWLAGVLALAPAADLGVVHDLHLSNDAATELLGGSPQERPQEWAHADPARQVLTTPAAVVIAERDESVPRRVIDSYLQSRSEQEPCQSAVARGADHGDVIDPDHPAYLLVLAEIEEHTLH